MADCIYVPRAIDNQYHCPYSECWKAYPAFSSLRTHRDRQHPKLSITKIHPKTPEEIQKRAREYQQKSRQKKKMRRASFTLHDAKTRGTFSADGALLEYKKSRIPDAGNGVFAAVDLCNNDIVTVMSGKRIRHPPKNPEYAIQLEDTLYLDGIRKPRKGKGLGSFINKEVRMKGMTKMRKNCEVIYDGIERVAMIKVLKKIKAGEELYSTYSRGYRIQSKTK